jgi:hypothetical protein
VTESERHEKQRSNHDGGRFRIKLSRDRVPPPFTLSHTNTPSQPSHLALHFRVPFHARPLQHLSRTLRTILPIGRKAALRFIKQKPPSSCNKIRPPTNPAFTARNFWAAYPPWLYLVPSSLTFRIFLCAEALVGTTRVRNIGLRNVRISKAMMLLVI